VPERARLGLTFLGDGRQAAEAMLTNHWLAADGLAARLGLTQRVRDSVEPYGKWRMGRLPHLEVGRRCRGVTISRTLLRLTGVGDPVYESIFYSVKNSSV
jgi:hypothetical protein